MSSSRASSSPVAAANTTSSPADSNTKENETCGTDEAVPKRSATEALDNTRQSKTPKKDDSEDSKKSANSNTPYDIFFAKLEKYIEDNGFKGYTLIKGIDTQDDDDDDDDEESHSDDGNEDTSKYTKEQMESLRLVLVTPSRSSQLDEMEEVVLQDQAGESLKMFNTSFSYHVRGTWESVVSRKINGQDTNAMTPAAKLDLLIAYTFLLKEYDVWMRDNEGDMDTVVKGLASAWKRLLTDSSDEELGWDLEYTKPGVMELLNQFQDAVDSASEDCYDLGNFQYM